jgi:hypothetical protein
MTENGVFPGGARRMTRANLPAPNGNGKRLSIAGKGNGGDPIIG